MDGGKDERLPLANAKTTFQDATATRRSTSAISLRLWGKEVPLLRVGLVLFACFTLQQFAKRIGSETTSHQGCRPLSAREAEQLFLTIPNAQSAISASRQFATKPHLAGSAGDLETAKDFLDLLQRELGISPPRSTPIFSAGTPESRSATLSISKLTKPQAWIDTYYPVMNTPLERRLVVVADNGSIVWEADLEEKADPTDPDAHKYSEAVPTFHGLSRGGDVTGPLIYANYGTQEDYKDLLSKGVDLTGAIVICRYGQIFRGLKVKGAQELGAAGVLIYSDLRDDGTVIPENGYQPYPHGPARNPTSVQRGSVQYLSIHPGDPTTPGYPAYENSTRTEGMNIPKIPSLPISSENADALWKHVINGEAAANLQIRLVNKVDDRVIPIWNTIGVIPGHIRDEVVMLGNHRDAWVMGAADPSSGTASIHEVIRGFGALVKKGWKPLRTIVIASWDAEEYGLIGSTEYGEDFADWIDAHVVAYLNLDSSVSGSRLSVSGSPLLAHVIRRAAEDLPHPTESGRTLWSATGDSGTLTGGNASSLDRHRCTRMQGYMADNSVGVNPLGSGSDYTVFLERLGVPSTNGGFSSSAHDPVYHYHSIYDSQRWQELYADPGFARHVAIAKHLGLQALRIASDFVLPFNTSHYASELDSYLDGVQEIAVTQSIDVDLKPLRSSIRSLQAASLSLDIEKLGAERELVHLLKRWRKRHTKRRRALRRLYCRIKYVLGFHCDRHRSDSAPEAPDLDGAAVALAFAYDDEHLCPHALKSGGSRRRLRRLRRAVKRVRAANSRLIAFERGLISQDGIKDREWYRHLGMAPGKWLGYGATTLPGLTEALTFDKNKTLAEYEVGRLKFLIDGITAKLRDEC
ncbi:hypothetical protein HGRIS_009363 [Hohenbuehelia grisea]|uniref:Zn-dependent exopeptidase n=1 Tax=Hohenbuehelia grisea TaxID=104357 RepID=A0ABR3J1B0_9AGAR